MLLTHFVHVAKCLAPFARTMATQAGPLVDLSFDNDGIAILTMNRPPVNSLNLELLQEIGKSLDEVAKNNTKGMILTSSSAAVFSAGLDIMEMYKPDLKRAETFWTTLQDVWLKLYNYNIATAAAINGHAPAGGCLLSLSCEYRVMVEGKYTIGINEAALGIVAPFWLIDVACHTITARQAEYALTTAKMFTVDEALQVGLIDESATDKTEAIDKCKKFIRKFDRIPPLARSITKQRIREDTVTRLQKNRQQDVAEFLGLLKNPQVQQTLEMYIQSMKQKSAK